MIESLEVFNSKLCRFATLQKNYYICNAATSRVEDLVLLTKFSR